MQYVDLGKLSQRDGKKSKRKKLIKFSTFALLLGVIIYSGYVLYWPASTFLGQLIKQPKSVLSLIQNPQGEIKSTDGRTNILLVGIDKRSNVPYSYIGPGGEIRKNGFLTDTIMVASIDKNTKKVAMVSIPRDTWVKIPAFGKLRESYGKINSLYSIGNTNNYPTGGMGLLEKQIEENLGIPIHYGVRVDFDGFRKGIDTLGGVDIVVDRSFDDFQYPADGQDSAKCKDGTYSCRFERLRFTQGPAHLDGNQALKFVRSRKGTNGEGSDFARARRQQKVLVAAKDKLLKLDNLLNPIKLNNLYKDFGQSIETDLDVNALVALYNLGKDIKIEQINSLVLDSSADNYLYTPPESQYGGAFVLIPKGNDWSKIKQAVEDLFKDSSNKNTPAKTSP